MEYKGEENERKNIKKKHVLIVINTNASNITQTSHLIIDNHVFFPFSICYI